MELIEGFGDAICISSLTKQKIVVAKWFKQQKCIISVIKMGLSSMIKVSGLEVTENVLNKLNYPTFT